MGSLEHAETELLNLSTWEWNTYTSYFNYNQIYSFAVIFNQDMFYIIGGETKNEVLSLVATFNPETDKWSRIGVLKFPRSDHKINAIDNKVFIVGGSGIPEYCDLTYELACSLFTDADFNKESDPILYAFNPSICKIGSFKFFAFL